MTVVAIQIESIVELEQKGEERLQTMTALTAAVIPAESSESEAATPESTDAEICLICYSNTGIKADCCSHRCCNQCFDHYIRNTTLGEYGRDSVLKLACLGCKEKLEYVHIAPRVQTDTLTRLDTAIARCSLKGLKICHSCGYCGWLPELECTVGSCPRCEAIIGNPSESLFSWSKSKMLILFNTRRCYHCGVRIEKNQGCQHMTCKSCNGEFCWRCGGKWHGHNYSVCNFKEFTFKVLLPVISVLSVLYLMFGWTPFVKTWHAAVYVFNFLVWLGAFPFKPVDFFYDYLHLGVKYLILAPIAFAILFHGGRLIERSSGDIRGLYHKILAFKKVYKIKHLSLLPLAEAEYPQILYADVWLALKLASVAAVSIATLCPCWYPNWLTTIHDYAAQLGVYMGLFGMIAHTAVEGMNSYRRYVCYGRLALFGAWYATVATTRYFGIVPDFVSVLGTAALAATFMFVPKLRRKIVY